MLPPILIKSRELDTGKSPFNIFHSCVANRQLCNLSDLWSQEEEAYLLLISGIVGVVAAVVDQLQAGVSRGTKLSQTTYQFTAIF